MLNRRHFIVSSSAMAVTAPAFAKGLDPRDKDISFGTTGSIFGTWPNSGTQNSISMKMSTDMPMMLADVKHYGLEGFEMGPDWLAYVHVPGQSCMYNVWSSVGKEHLEALVDHLRVVELK